MKKILVFFLTFVVALSFCGCQNLDNYAHTDIEFSKNNVFLLTQEFLAEISEDAVNIYNVDSKVKNAELYDSIDGEYEIADFCDDVLLLQNEISLIAYNLSTKEKTDIYSEVFESETKDSYFKYQTFFADETSNLIVKKIVYKTESPIDISGTQVGFEVSGETGIYIYEFSNGKVKQVKIIGLEDLEIELKPEEGINISAASIGNGDISLVVKVNPVGVPFYSEYYYKISSDFSVLKIGESPITESQDMSIQHSYSDKRFIKASEKRVVCVDFENGKIYRFEHDNIDNVKGVDILDVPDTNYFFVNIGTASGDLLFKYKTVKGNLNCEEGNSEMLATAFTIQNGFARGNRLYFPADAEARKFGTLFVNGTTYRSYSDKGYLCESDGKTVVIFE